MTGLSELTSYYWSMFDLQEGLEALIAAGGRSAGATTLIERPNDWDEIQLWLVDAPRALGLEGSQRWLKKHELLAHLLRPGEHIVGVDSPDDATKRNADFVMLVSTGARCRLVGAGGSDVEVSTVEVTDRLLAAMLGNDPRLARIFATVGGGIRAHQRMQRRERLDRKPIVVWSYRRDAATPLMELAREQGALRDTTIFLVTTILQLLFTAFAAYTFGSAALNGIVDRGRLVAWIMVSLVAVPLTYFASLSLSRVSLTVGGAIKRRSLEGAFSVGEDTLRREGYSAMLARINETSRLERVSVADAFGILVPTVMIALSLYLFATSSRRPLTFVVLAIVVLAMLVLMWVESARRQVAAYRRRTAITSDVVDKLIGHRTRAVQENPKHWHDSEDRSLAEYARSLGRVDLVGAACATLPRVWLLAAGSLLAIDFVVNSNGGPILLPGLAIVLFSTALSGLGSVVERTSVLVTSWKASKDLLAAGRQRPRRERRVHTADEQKEWPTVLATSAMSFAYRQGARPIFSDASVRVRRGERILVEGPSGGGKSTLAKIIAGELRPRGGSILVCGLDPFTGSELQWRKLVASVPQFHENHVFSQTLAFNVDPLLGRSQFSDEARTICEELELGAVLAKMPAGASQLLGETGWQLSHGERSRLFIARALLQKAQLIILDESFAALDPVTMRTVVACVRRRARTVMVIAHV
jgi:ATP-binding cassette subfamily B protein